MTAPTAANFAIGSLEGADFTATYSVVTATPDIPGPPFAVGTHVIGNNGTEYVFVKAAASLAQWQCVALDSSFNARTATITRVLQRQQLAWAQVAITSGLYGWVALRGDNVGALTKLGSLANVKLYVSGTSPGVLTSTSIRTTCSLVTGVILTSSATSAAIGSGVSGPMSVLATWPRPME